MHQNHLEGLFKHRLLPKPRISDSVSLQRGSRNCLSNKFPADAAGAVATFWVPQLRWSSFTRWKTNDLKNINVALNSSNNYFSSHFISPCGSQSDHLKIWTNLYRTLELLSGAIEVKSTLPTLSPFTWITRLSINSSFIGLISGHTFLPYYLFLKCTSYELNTFLFSSLHWWGIQRE